MRYLYTFLFYLALPLIFLRLLWRSRKEPLYRERMLERVGFYSFKLDCSIWVHAVSMGEVIAAVPLIKNLQERYPEMPILVTTMTPTGAVQVKAAFADSVRHAYLPYDLPDAMQRFLRASNPVIAIMMETELWPNLFAALKKRSIPICLLNARLSLRSANRYHYFADAVKNMLTTITVIAANSPQDAEQFIRLGADSKHVQVTGNVKFDLQVTDTLQPLADELRKKLGSERFVWVAASTHPGEEEVILIAHEKLRATLPDALLILVPRHQSRFKQMALLASEKFNTAKRSEQRQDYQDIGVFLGDSMGELMLFYAAGDVAFVGGSLVPRGGHNFIEPAALGRAILIGPHVFNFSQMYALFAERNAIMQVLNADGLTESLLLLASDTARRNNQAALAKQVIIENRGALSKQLQAVENVLIKHSCHRAA